MTEQLSSFEGIELTANDENTLVNIITTDSDPSIGVGISAPVGSLALSTLGNGRAYYKHNVGNNDWVTVFTQLPGEFANLTPIKSILSNNDRVLIEDSEDSFNKKYSTTQNIIDLVTQNSGQGLDFSRRGNINATTVLLTRDGILSSNSGHPIGISNPVLSSINVSTRDLNTYTLRVFQHEGSSINRLNLADVSATNTRNLRAVEGVDFTQINTINPNSQLAVELISGTARDIMVEVVLSGTL